MARSLCRWCSSIVPLASLEARDVYSLTLNVVQRPVREDGALVGTLYPCTGRHLSQLHALIRYDSAFLASHTEFLCTIMVAERHCTKA